MKAGSDRGRIRARVYRYALLAGAPALITVAGIGALIALQQYLRIGDMSRSLQGVAIVGVLISSIGGLTAFSLDRGSRRALGLDESVLHRMAAIGAPVVLVGGAAALNFVLAAAGLRRASGLAVSSVTIVPIALVLFFALGGAAVVISGVIDRARVK